MERALEGVSAAPGTAIGPAMLWDRATTGEAGDIAIDKRPAEVERAVTSLQRAAADLERIANRLRSEGRNDEAEIIDVGVLMAADAALVARVEMHVLDSGMPAPQALRVATEESASELAQLPDPLIALRADDVRSLGRRAAAVAAGMIQRPGESVLVARTLGPADVAEYAPLARGIALAQGGVTSHAAIVARSMGLPMVVGLGDGVLGLSEEDEVVIDGDHGILLVQPTSQHVEYARADGTLRREARDRAIASREQPARTTDGRFVRVLANASTVSELGEAMIQGAEGVGLLRTELLFLEATAWPSQLQQVNVLRPVLSRLAGKTATVRLFDFGGDKTPPFLRGIKTRGIEVLLDSREELDRHLAAILDAGRGTHLRLLVPMVTTPDQMRIVREAMGDPGALGAMIETPQAAHGAAAIAAESDFLSIGTNDLTQLVLGLERDQSRRAPVLDPRVLDLIAKTMRAARAAGIPVDVCGEAASDAHALPVMVGFGADELSVAPARVGQVRQWIR